MPYVADRCPRCDGALRYVEAKEKYFCDYCDTFVSWQDIIQKITNYNTANIGSLHLEGVSFCSEMTTEVRMELGAAEANMKMQNYEEARNRFERLSIHIPQDYHVWWGQIRAITKEFKADIDSRGMLEALQMLYERTMLFAPQQEQDVIEWEFMNYYEKNWKDYDEKIKALEQRVKDLETERDNIEASIRELEQVEYPKLGHISEEVQIILMIAFLIGIFGRVIPFSVGVPICAAVWELVILPLDDRSAGQWEEDRKCEIEGLRQQSADVDRELAEIGDKLRKLSG